MANNTDWKSVLSDFIDDVDAQELTDAEIFEAYPEFGNDVNLLDAAYQYRTTFKEQKYDEPTLQSKFPEFFKKGIPTTTINGVRTLQREGQSVLPLKGAPKEEATPKKENKGGFWQSLGSNDPYSINTQKGLAEQAAKEKVERERVASILTTNEDEQALSDYERSVREATFGVDETPFMSVTPEGRIELNVQKEDKTPNLIPASEEDVQQNPQVASAREKVPEHMLRGMDSEDDIMRNFYDRWTTNTDEGKAALKQANDNLTAKYEEITRLYAEDTQRLQNDINAGKMTVEQAQAEQKRLLDGYKKQYSDYELEQDNAIRQQVYNANKDAIDWQLRQLGSHRTDATVAKMMPEVDDKINEINGKLQKERERAQLYAGGSSFGGAYGEIGSIASSNMIGNPKLKEDAVLYAEAKHFLEEAEKISAAVREGKSFGSGFAEGITDINTWDFGIGNLARSIDLKRIVDKSERWDRDHKPEDKLTEAESTLLNAVGTYAMAQAYNADLLSRGYKAGQSSAQSVPFMLQFAFMPISSIQNGVARGVFRQLLKTGMKRQARNFISRTVGLTLGGLEAAAIQTAAFGGAHIAEGTISGVTGQIQGDFDEEGNTVFGGIAEGSQKNIFTSLKDATVSELGENWSEIAFNALTPIKRLGFVRSAFKGFDATGVGQAIAAMKNSGIGRFAKQTQWHGIITEDLEEQLNNLTRWAFVSDVNSADEAGFNLDDQIDTFLALAPTSIVFGAVAVGAYYGPILKNAASLRHSMTTKAEKMMFDTIMRESRSGEFGAKAHDIVRNIVTNNEISPEAKRVLLETTFAQYHSDLSEKSQEAVDALAEERYGTAFDKSALGGMTNEDNHKIVVGYDDRGREFIVTKGNVVTEDVDGETVVNTKDSDKKLTIRYVNMDGTLGDPMEVKNDFAVGPVGVYIPSEERARYVERGKAIILGDKTYKHDGATYSVADNTRVSVDKKAPTEDSEEPVVANEPTPAPATTQEEPTPAPVQAIELPEGVEPIDTNKRRTMDVTLIPVTLKGGKTDVYMTSMDYTLNEDGTINFTDENGNVDKKKLANIRLQHKDMSPISEEKEKVGVLMAINMALRAERYKTIKEAREAQEKKRKEEQRAQTAEAQAQRAKEEANAARNKFRSELPLKKNGELNTNEATPEQIFFYELENGSEQDALATTKDQILWHYGEIDRKGMQPIEKSKNRRAIESYYAAVQKWVGKETADALRAEVDSELAPQEEATTPANAPAAPAVTPESSKNPETKQEPTPAPAPAPEVEDENDNDGEEEDGEEQDVIKRMRATLSPLPEGTRGRKQIRASIKRLAEALKMPEDKKSPDAKAIAILNEVQTMRENLKRMEDKLPDLEAELDAIEAQMKEQGYEISSEIQDGKVYNEGMRVVADFVTEEGEGKPVIKFVRKPMIFKDGKMRQAGEITVTQYVPKEEMKEGEDKPKQELEKINLESDDIIIVQQNSHPGNLIPVRKNAEGKWVNLITGRVLQGEILPEGSERQSKGWMTVPKQVVYLDEKRENRYILLSPVDLGSRIVNVASVQQNGHVEKMSVKKTDVFMDVEGQEKPAPMTKSTAPKRAQVTSAKFIEEPIFTFDGVNYTIDNLIEDVEVESEGKKVKRKRYSILLQNIKDKYADDTELANEATDRLVNSMIEFINNFNSFANSTLADIKLSSLEDTEALRAFKWMRYRQFELERNKAMDAKNQQGVREAEEKMSSTNFIIRVDGGIRRELKEDSYPESVNPFKQIPALLAIVRQSASKEKLPIVLPGWLDKDAKVKDIVSVADIEKARADYKKISEKDEIGRQEKAQEYPEVKNDYPAIMRPKVFDTDRTGYNHLAKRIKAYAEFVSTKEAKDKAFEDFKDRLSVLFNAYMSQDEEAFDAVNKEIEETIKSHKDDRRYIDAAADMQRNITANERKRSPELARLSDMHKQLDTAQAELERVQASQREVDKSSEEGREESKKKDVSGRKKGERRTNFSEAINIARNKVEGIQNAIEEFEERYPDAADAYREYVKKEQTGAVKIQFSVDDELPISNPRTNIVYRTLEKALSRVPGIKLHHVGSQEDARALLERMYGNLDDVTLKNKEEIEFFRTPNGTILGWAIGNEIYLTDEGMNSETPLHEYTHLWAKSLALTDPSSWKRIVRMCKKNSKLWNSVKNDSNYQDLDSDDAIASELLARYSGKHGSERLEKELKKIVADSSLEVEGLEDSLIKKMKAVLKEFWDKIKSLFDIDSLDDISDWVLKDLFDGKPLNLSEAEMENIKTKAIQDGTFMKAPNGNQTNLTEKQWLQVRTTAFKEWFGDWENPKEGEFFLLDANGEPLVIYHGSPYAGFDVFVPKDMVFDENGEAIFIDNQRATYTTPTRPIASVYAHGIDEDIEEAKLGTNSDQSLGRYNVIGEGIEEAYFFTEEDAANYIYELGFSPDEDYEGAPEIIDTGVDMHLGVYSLFAKIKNPKIVDFSDEDGNPSPWDRYQTGRYVVYQGFSPAQTFDTYEEAQEYANAMTTEFSLDSDNAPRIRPEYWTTDMICAQAQGEGYDGVIFNNIIDGSDSTALIGTEYYNAGHQVIAIFTPDQVKSATQNNGMFSQDDLRIQFAVADSHAEHMTEEIDEERKTAEISLIMDMADAQLTKDGEMGRLEKFITTMLDRTESIRRMMDSINAMRKLQGLPPIDEKHDIRTRIESIQSIASNEKAMLREKEGLAFQKAYQELEKMIRKSAFYKKYKEETSPYGDANAAFRDKTILTPLQLLERYMMMVDDLVNRYPKKKERGMIEVAKRIRGEHWDVKMKREAALPIVQAFVDEFEAEFGERDGSDNPVERLWAATKAMTDYSITRNYESGQLSEDKYRELLTQKYYVPQRGNFHSEEEERKNSDNNKNDDQKKYGDAASISISSLHKAEGSPTLGNTPIAYVMRDAEESISNGENNKVRILMYELLRANTAWCNGRMPVPGEVWFEKFIDEDDIEKVRKVRRSGDEYRRMTIEDIDEEIAKLDERRMSAASADEFEDITEKIDSLNKQKALSVTRSEAAKAYAELARDEGEVAVYINGVLHSMTFPRRYMYVHDALIGEVNHDWELKGVKAISGWISAQFTVNNPTFWAVNLVRDIPFVLSKGTTEYGPIFTARFIKNLALCMPVVARYAFAKNSLWAGKVMDATSKSSDTGLLFEQFLEAGGNTGYSNMPGIEEFRANVRNLVPGLSWKDMTAKDKRKRALSVTANVVDKVIGVVQLRSLANILNEYSELITRFAIYRSMIEMHYGQNEAVKAAHNLSVNFNRKAYGNAFVNGFNALSMFANATVQGATGFYRGFYKGDTRAVKGGYGEIEYTSAARKAWQPAAFATNAILIPAALGFLNTLLMPDDDDYVVSDWDRDNYAIFGDVRIPLNEQLKPWWCLGVNIALATQGRRTPERARWSFIESFVRNEIPVAPNLTDAIMAGWGIEKSSTSKVGNLADVLITAIVPASMQSIFQLSRNENFMGGKLRRDEKNVPEFMQAPYEAELTKDLSYLLYRTWGGGRTDLNTDDETYGLMYRPVVDKKTGRTHYEPIRRIGNVNPKEWRPWFFFIPGGAQDFINLGYAVGKDIVKGNSFGTSVRTKDMPIVNRFVHDQQIEANNASIAYTAKSIIEKIESPMDELSDAAHALKTNAELKGTDNSKAYKVQDELYANFGEDNPDMAIAKALQTLTKRYDAVHIQKRAKQFGLKGLGGKEDFKEELDIVIPETVEECEKLERQICLNMDFLIKMYQGIESDRLLNNGVYGRPLDDNEKEAMKYSTEEEKQRMSNENSNLLYKDILGITPLYQDE